ncbi:MAG: hypothetical protein AB1690_02425 [Candidatus Zixiibacteriota bacterium]
MGIARADLSEALRRLSQGLMDIYALRERKRLRREEMDRENRQFDWQQKKFYLGQEEEERQRREAAAERDTRLDIQQRNEAWNRELELRRLGLSEKRFAAEQEEKKRPPVYAPSDLEKRYQFYLKQGKTKEEALQLARNEKPEEEKPSLAEWVRLWNAMDSQEKAQYGNDPGVFKQAMLRDMNRKMVIGGVLAEEAPGWTNQATWNGYVSKEAAMKDLDEDLRKGLISSADYDDWKRQIEGVFGK